jgi:hypothetical protein
MPDNLIGGTTAGDLTNALTDFSIDAVDTDGAGSSKETTWQNPFWSSDYGYYKKIPEFKRAVDTKALWTVGAGFEADEPTEMILNNIKGNGNDSFNSILKNLIKVKTISMDSFAEIIRDDPKNGGALLNLKPLDPSSIVIVQNQQGRIIRYEQVFKDKIPNKKYRLDQIFHLSHDRIADEIHGTRILESLASLILARNEAMADWKVVLHRNVRPVRIWYLDTDDDSEISAFIAKTDKAYENTENIFIPKGTVETEVATVAPNSTLNPLMWIEKLNDYFFQAVNVPQIITGNAKEFTDASGKIVYLAYEQSVKEEQMYVEEQVLNQLNLEINLTFPATLQNEMISSRDKDSDLEAAAPRS